MNLRQICGIAVEGNVVHVQTLDVPVSIESKKSLIVPAMRFSQCAAITAIKSAQLKKRLLIVEVMGAMTGPVKEVIAALATQLHVQDIVTAFFLCGTPKEPTEYFFGFGLDLLRKATPVAKNIRLLNEGNGILFTTGPCLKYLGLSQINECWEQVAVTMYVAQKSVAFLGRVQPDKTAALTLSDETTFIVTITRTEAHVAPFDGFCQKVTAVFGHLQEQVVGATQIIAGIKGQELILIPARR